MGGEQVRIHILADFWLFAWISLACLRHVKLGQDIIKSDELWLRKYCFTFKIWKNIVWWAPPQGPKTRKYPKITRRCQASKPHVFCSATDVGLVICVLILSLLSFSVENGWFTTHLPQKVSEKHVQFLPPSTTIHFSVNTWKLHRPRHGGTVALSQREICVGKEDLDYGQPLGRQHATQIPLLCGRWSIQAGAPTKIIKHGNIL